MFCLVSHPSKRCWLQQSLSEFRKMVHIVLKSSSLEFSPKKQSRKLEMGGYVPDNRDNRTPIRRSLDSDANSTHLIVLGPTSGVSCRLVHQTILHLQ